MGWLRDLMDAAETPIPSFGRLAQLCLSHGDWPEYVQPQARSLAALFSKFDRSVELEWLQDRADVQHVLTRVLGCSAAEILRPVAGGTQRKEEHVSRWRLVDAPLARAFELLEEPLPPCIPPELARPDRWQRQLWVAGSRSERDLVARWLATRRLAQVSGSLVAESDSELPVFAQIDALPPFVPPAMRVQQCAALLTAPDSADAWQTVAVPRLLDLVPTLANWLVDRFPKDSRLTREILRQWLIRGVRDGVVDGLESALGLAAVLDELEPHPPLTLKWPELVERFVAFRLERASVKERVEVQWLTRNSLPTLTALMDALLSDPGSSWDAPRTPEQWLAIVPRELQAGFDTDWARRSLATAAAPLLAKDFEQALARVPPGAFRIVRALEAAGLLTGVSSLVFGPRWLCLVLRRSVEQRVLQGPALGWGEALLHPGFGARIREGLESRLTDDPIGVLDAVFDLDELPGAAATLAIETVFELVGQALILGEHFDGESLQVLWSMQAARWVQLDPQNVVPSTLCRHDDLQRLGSWLLSTWAISEQLEGLQTHPVLNPWVFPIDLPDRSLDAVLQFLLDTSTQTLVRQGFALTQRIDARAAEPIGHRLFLPGRFAMQPTAEDLVELGAHPRLQAALVDALDNQADSRMQQIWELWWSAGNDPQHPLFRPDAPHAHALWSCLPDAVLGEMLRSDHAFCKQLPYQHLTLEHFQRLVLSNHAWATEQLLHLPETLLPAAVESFAHNDKPEALAALWWSFGPKVCRTLQLLAEREDWSACAAVLNAAPITPDRELLEWVRARVEVRGIADPLSHLARPWLQRVASCSGPLRLDAFAVLSDIEARLKRVQLAAG